MCDIDLEGGWSSGVRARSYVERVKRARSDVFKGDISGRVCVCVRCRMGAMAFFGGEKKCHNQSSHKTTKQPACIIFLEVTQATSWQ